MSPQTAEAPARLRWTVWVLGTLLLAVLWRLALQPRMYGDGPRLVQFLAEGSWSYHALHRALGELGVRLGAAPRAVLEALSPLAMAAGVAVCLSGLRRAERPWIGALVACAPVTLFFVTTIEVHAVQFLAAALAVQLARRSRAARGAARGAWLLAAVALAALGHPLQVLLAPSLVLLALRRRRQRLVGCAALSIGLVLVLLLAQPLASWLERSIGGATSGPLASLGRWVIVAARLTAPELRPDAREVLGFAWSELLLPAGLVTPCAALGIAWRDRRSQAWLVGGVLLLACSSAFRVRELGGYSIGLLPFAVSLVAAGARRMRARAPRALPWAIGTALALQAAGALAWRHAWNERADDGALCAAVRRWFDEEHLPPGSALVISVGDARKLELEAAAPVQGLDLRYAVDALPRRDAGRRAREWVESTLPLARAGQVIAADARLFAPGFHERRIAPLVAEFERAFSFEPVESSRGADGAPLLFRAVPR
jgi:hypothetical protein